MFLCMSESYYFISVDLNIMSVCRSTPPPHPGLTRFKLAHVSSIEYISCSEHKQLARL